jgi:hypothetical protein
MNRFVLVLCLLAGCASSESYVKGPRVTAFVDEGDLHYAVNGKLFEAGVFGGGLIDAVSGNSRAEEAARWHRVHKVGAFTSALLLSLCMTDVVVASSQEQEPSPVVWGCALSTFVSSVLFNQYAQARQWDAINFFNLPPSKD